MKHVVISLVFLFCFCQALPASALEYKVKKDTQDTVIQASGWIGEQDIATLETLLNEYPDNITLELNSKGGVAKAGMQIGLILKQNPRVSTVILPGNVCVSACALAFLGANQRLIYPGGKIGFHRVYNQESDLSQMSRRELEFQSMLLGFVMGRYFSLLGIDNELLYKSLDYGPEEVWLLSDSELSQYQVTTGTP